jgi:ATP phosphoribosyltransferase regulatory subunit
MLKSQTVARQLPHGVADLFFEDSARKAQVETLLKQTFDRWSYSEIIPPTFEYFEPLQMEASPQVREEIYRFFDRDGRMLALRADPTIPIARIVSTKLQERPLPLRFFYVTTVFRYEEPKAALRREFTQAGVELIGANTAAADAEGIALAVTALREIGLRDFRLRVGTMSFINALLAELELPPARGDALKLALERKSEHQLMEVLNGDPIRPGLRRALARLPELNGGRAVLEVARQDCSVNDNTREALERLSAVYDYLEAMDCAGNITLDLAMVRGMAYYTGVVFEGFVPGIGFAIMSGGRYDNLLAHFGRDLPAFGFAIGVERVLAAVVLQGGQNVDLSPEVVAESSTDRALAQRVGQARQAGRRVEQSLERCSRAELVAYARRRGAREAWFGDGSVEVSR